jgi:hypothetical protein
MRTPFAADCGAQVDVNYAPKRSGSIALGRYHDARKKFEQTAAGASH